jgi:hypothetical protein
LYFRNAGILPALLLKERWSPDRQSLSFLPAARPPMPPGMVAFHGIPSYRNAGIPAGIFSKGTPDSSLALVVNYKRAELVVGVPLRVPAQPFKSSPRHPYGGNSICKESLNEHSSVTLYLLKFPGLALYSHYGGNFKIASLLQNQRRTGFLLSFVAQLAK